MADDLAIADSHIHIWGADTAARPWAPAFPAPSHGPPEVTASGVLREMDAAGVGEALLVPPSFEGDRNDLVLAATEAHPDRFRCLGRFSLLGDGAAERIAGAAGGPMLGLRLSFNGAAAPMLEDGSIDWVWGLAAELGLHVSLYPARSQLPRIAEIAKAHPRLRISIDHLAAGKGPGDRDPLEPIRRLRLISALPNVAVKATALPASFPDAYSPALVRGVVDLALSMFGPNRVFWGSDLTRAPQRHGDYAETVRAFLAGIGHLPAVEAQMVMGGGMREWFGWVPGS